MGIKKKQPSHPLAQALSKQATFFSIRKNNPENIE
jgi:hypothetical protein